jgi:hypothetical protein
MKCWSTGISDVFRCLNKAPSVNNRPAGSAGVIAQRKLTGVRGGLGRRRKMCSRLRDQRAISACILARVSKLTSNPKGANNSRVATAASSRGRAINSV